MEIDELLIHTTIRIEADLGNGMQSTGTGFFYTFFDDEKFQVPCIITNKHVVNGAKCLKLRFSLSENGKLTNEQCTFELNDLEKIIINHPDNSIDLCIILIANLISFFKDKKESLYYTTLTNKDIPDEKYIQDKVSNIEDITVIGYPDGIWDFANNLPIVRKGITATSLKYDFENTPKFLIDSAIYGGSSGSPVFIYNQGAYSIKNTLYAGGRVKLIGIVYAVAQHKVNGEIKIVLAPAINTKPIAEAHIPNNLGVVIKAKKIFDFEAILKIKITQEAQEVNDKSE